MSCHTWTYIKMRPEDIATEKAILKSKLMDSDIMNLSKEEFVTKLLNIFNKDTSEEWAEFYDKERPKIEKLLKDGISDIDLANESFGRIERVDGNLYSRTDCDTPFRMFTYTDACFTNKDKLLKWLKDNQTGVIFGYYADDYGTCIYGYTDELVKRIEEYFAIYGEDNLYFEFG